MHQDSSARSAKDICKSINKSKTALRACGAQNLTSLARTFGILEAAADPLIATGMCKKIAELLKKPDAVAELMKVGKLEAGIPISHTSEASGMPEVIIGVSNHPSIVVAFSNLGLRQTIRRDKVEFRGRIKPAEIRDLVEAHGASLSVIQDLPQPLTQPTPTPTAREDAAKNIVDAPEPTAVAEIVDADAAPTPESNADVIIAALADVIAQQSPDGSANTTAEGETDKLENGDVAALLQAPEASEVEAAKAEDTAIATDVAAAPDWSVGAPSALSSDANPDANRTPRLSSPPRRPPIGMRHRPQEASELADSGA